MKIAKHQNERKKMKKKIAKKKPTNLLCDIRCPNIHTKSKQMRKTGKSSS